MRSLDDNETLIAFFEARRGQLFGFSWKDWTDYKSTQPSGVPGFKDQIIGTGDGQKREFQLSKTYRSGEEAYTRLITKPVAGTILVSVADDQLVETVHFDADAATGIISFVDIPDQGVEITAGFEFDVPVRFDTDRLEMSLQSFSAAEIPTVPVVEVRV